MADELNLEEDDLIKKLVKDPTKGSEGEMLVGFLGKSDREGYWRLYLTPELNEYISFHESDIAHYDKLNPAQSPLGGSMLWLKPNTKVKQVRTSSTQEQLDLIRRSNTAQQLSAGPMEDDLAAGMLGRAPDFGASWRFCFSRGCCFRTFIGRP